MKCIYLFCFSVLLWKVSFLVDFTTTYKIYVLCLVCFSVTAIWTIWSIAVLFPPSSITLASLCPSLPTSHPTGWAAQLFVLRKSSVPVDVFIA